MPKILFIITMVLLASCSTEKRIANFIKKEGAKNVAVHLVRSYPEYFKPDSVTIDTTLQVPVETKAPEVTKDTIMPVPVASDTCLKYHRHIDENLDFEIRIENGKKHVKYKIRERIVRDTVKVHFKVTEPCPPCPETVLIEQMDKELNNAKSETELIKKDVDYWRIRFFILVGLILFGIAFKFRKMLGIPV